MHNNLNSILLNKNVLYIPIISMINRETGEYNLAGDGNVNRLITVFSEANTFKNLTIYLPLKHVNGSEIFLNKFKDINHNINLIYSEFFGEHALEQRKDLKLINNLLKSIKNINNYDIIISESQYLTKQLLKLKDRKYKLIYWSPVCAIPNKSRVFLNGYEEIDKFNFTHADYSIIAAEDQYDYLKSLNIKNIFYIPKLINRDLQIFDYCKDKDIETLLNKINSENIDKIYYIPYRVTDEGYHIEYVVHKLLQQIFEYKKKIKVLYTNPNNAKENILTVVNKIYNNEFNNDVPLKDLYNIFVQVKNDRDSYYTTLDSKYKVIIPYFEDLSFINHASIHEFVSDKSTCKIILLKTDKHFYFENNTRITYIDKKEIDDYEKRNKK